MEMLMYRIIEPSCPLIHVYVLHNRTKNGQFPIRIIGVVFDSHTQVFM